jgi:hypothetical protein
MPRGVGQARPHGASSHLWPHRTRSDAALALPHLAGSPFAPAWLTASIPAATQTGCHKPAGRGRGRGPRTLGGCRPYGTARPHPGPCNTRAASDVLTVPPCWWSPPHFPRRGLPPAFKRKNSGLFVLLLVVRNTKKGTTLIMVITINVVPHRGKILFFLFPRGHTRDPHVTTTPSIHSILTTPVSLGPCV